MNTELNLKGPTFLAPLFAASCENAGFSWTFNKYKHADGFKLKVIARKLKRMNEHLLTDTGLLTNRTFTVPIRD